MWKGHRNELHCMRVRGLDINITVYNNDLTLSPAQAPIGAQG